MALRNNRSSGSAIIMAMLLLVLISAAGIYVISLPSPVTRDLRRSEREAVSRCMAIAGVHAAVARFPQGGHEGLPYVRYFGIARNITGKYTVSFWQSGEALRTVSSVDSSSLEYIVLSEGSVVASGDARHIIRATVRYFPQERKSRIVFLEESK